MPATPTHVVTNLKLVNSLPGTEIILSNIDGTRESLAGIASTNGYPWKANGWTRAGATCSYIDNGDGSAHILRRIPIQELVVDQYGHVYEIGRRLPMNATSLEEIDKRKAADLRTRMLAAGFSEADIDLVARNK